MSFIKYIPNTLTFFRIISVPFFLYSLFTGYELYALFIFIFASITDWLDGYIARKYNVITKFGIYFDPLADKILVSAAFISFLFLDSLVSSVELWMVVAILSRDIFVSILRFLINKNGHTMVTSVIAKFKTTIQMITILIILIVICFSNNFVLLFSFIKPLMLLTTFMTIYSGFDYFIKNKKLILSTNL